MGENSLGFVYPIIAGYCVCGHNGDTVVKLRATATNVSENLYQEAFLTPTYPNPLKGWDHLIK